MSLTPKEFWDLGVPLNQAFIHFYGFPKNKYEQYKKNYRFLEKPAEEGPNHPHHPEFYRFNPPEPFFRKELLEKWRIQFSEFLLGNLMTGLLIGVGIQLEPEKKTGFGIIPENQIPNSISELEFPHWDKNHFRGKTALYKRVSIVDPKIRLDAPPPLITDGRGSPKGGGPSQEDNIKHAFTVCAGQGLLDFTGTQDEAARVIQRFIKEEMPDEYGSGRGYGISTIKRHIKEDFNRRKRGS